MISEQRTVLISITAQSSARLSCFTIPVETFTSPGYEADVLPVSLLDGSVNITLGSLGSHCITLIVKLLALAKTDLHLDP